MDKEYIYIATYFGDGQPCVASKTRDGLQSALDEYNGLGTDINVSISDHKIFEYKYGGETLIEEITYRDLGETTKNHPEFEYTKYYIWLIEFN